MTLAESIRYLRIEGAVYVEIEIAPLVQLFLWHQQSPHSPDSHCAFFGHTDSNVLRVGIAYTSGRSGNLMLHLHQLVPRGWPHGRCSIGAI